jgi:hypothetical protein
MRPHAAAQIDQEEPKDIDQQRDGRPRSTLDSGSHRFDHMTRTDSSPRGYLVFSDRSKWATIGAFFISMFGVCLAQAQEFGSFDSEPVVRLLEEGRKAELALPHIYRDPERTVGCRRGWRFDSDALLELYRRPF